MPVFIMRYYVYGMEFKTEVYGSIENYTKEQLDGIREYNIEKTQRKLNQMGYSGN